MEWAIRSQWGGEQKIYYSGSTAYYYLDILHCPSAKINNAWNNNGMRVMGSYRYNYFLGSLGKTRNQTYYAGTLQKITQLSKHASKTVVIFDDWRSEIRANSIYSGSGRQDYGVTMTYLSTTKFPNIGIYGAHGQNANQLFADGHVEGKSTFTTTEDNYLRIWKSDTLKEFSL
jgi:prepilin-type processing-associated H-X9-DG protein